MSISVHRPTTRILSTLALGAVVPLVLVSCGGSSSTPAASTPVTPSPVASASPSLATDTPTATDTPSPTPTAVAANKPFGPGCPRLPDTGSGSLEDLATTPVATAASEVRVLSRLTDAIKVAGLTSRLNAARDITVVAPADSALTPKKAGSLFAHPTRPAGVLSLHVVTKRLSPADLAGTQDVERTVDHHHRLG